MYLQAKGPDFIPQFFLTAGGKCFFFIYVEYRINEAWAIRGGYLRDNNAVPDTHVEPSVPEGVRDLFSIGFGWTNGKFTVDGYYLLLLQQDREITTSTKTITGPTGEDVPFNGMYTGSGNLFGVTLGYAL